MFIGIKEMRPSITGYHQYNYSLGDAKAVIELTPTFLEAIMRG